MVNSLVNDIIMPPIGLLLASVNFSDLFFALDRKTFASLRLLNKPARRSGRGADSYKPLLISRRRYGNVLLRQGRRPALPQTGAAPAT
jgi:hypothetical protein